MINPPIFIELKENVKGLKIKYFKKEIGFESCEIKEVFSRELSELDDNILIIGHAYSLLAVSYTHLTLPTILLV